MEKLERPLAEAQSPAGRDSKPLHHFATAGCTVDVVKSWRDVHPPVWRALFQSRCKDQRYHEITEETLSDQFEHRYLVMQNSSGETAVQPFFIVGQDLLAGV